MTGWLFGPSPPPAMIRTKKDIAFASGGVTVGSLRQRTTTAYGSPASAAASINFSRSAFSPSVFFDVITRLLGTAAPPLRFPVECTTPRPGLRDERNDLRTPFSIRLV